MNFPKLKLWLICLILTVPLSFSDCNKKEESKDFAVVDVKQETDWDYWIIAKDGSNFFVEEENNVPRSVYYKPDSNQEGYIIFFNEFGLPSSAVIQGNTLLFSNIRDKLIDVTLIKSDNEVVNYDNLSSNIDLSLFQMKGGTNDDFLNFLKLTGHVVGAASCIASLIPGIGVFAMVGCAATIVGLLADNFPDQLEVLGIPAFTVSIFSEAVGCITGNVGNCIVYAADIGLALKISSEEKLINSKDVLLPKIGRVAYYPFNGNSNDNSGNNINGTVYGATLTTDRFGGVNRAYSFNGTSNYISVLHNSVFNVGTGDFSLHATILANTIPSTYGGAIITKHNTANWHDNEFNLYINITTGFPQFGLSTNAGVFERVDGKTNVCDGKFHSICGVRRSGKIFIYVDGKVEGSVNSAINPNNTNPINIGRSSYNSGNVFHFKGTIDNILVYNRALTDQEILSLSSL